MHSIPKSTIYLSFSSHDEFIRLERSKGSSSSSSASARRWMARRRMKWNGCETNTGRSEFIIVSWVATNINEIVAQQVIVRWWTTMHFVNYHFEQYVNETFLYGSGNGNASTSTPAQNVMCEVFSVKRRVQKTSNSKSLTLVPCSQTQTRTAYIFSRQLFARVASP